MNPLARSFPGLPAIEEALPLFLMLAGALAIGFLVGLWFYGERLRQAEWRARRAEAMSNSLRKLSDDYRRRLNGRSPRQVERELKEQERKLSLPRFQVASLSAELKAMRPSSAEIIDMPSARTSRT